MKYKARVLLIENMGDDKYYSVQYWMPVENYWTTWKTFSFGPNSTRTEEEAKSSALELAKMIERGNPRSETIVYETPTTSPPSNI